MQSEPSSADTLDQSRFLVEQLDLSEQPNEQQVLERAEELGIDDLLMARESLTREMEPYWKPYCNRNGEIYYINLLQRRAYVNHPVDMHYIVEYAKQNDNPVPKFASFTIDQVSQSMHLVEEQINKYKTDSRKSTLRIVYEEPSEEERASEHPKTPAHLAEFKQFEENRSKERGQLNSEELEELIAYERELEQQYERNYRQAQAEYARRTREAIKQHQQQKQKILDCKIEEQCRLYEEEVRNKNQLDFSKKKQKYEMQLQQRRLQYFQNVHKFNTLFQKLREKQRNAESYFQIKNASERAMMVENLYIRSQMEKQKAFNILKDKMRKQMRETITGMWAGGREYQHRLKMSLHEDFKGLGESSGWKQKTNKRRIFGNDQANNYKKQPQKDREYEKLKEQIKALSLWDNRPEILNPRHQNLTSAARSSLNLRLRMKIL